MMNSTPISKLTEIRDEIYGGSWNEMLVDLKHRLNKRPYNHRIEQQIKVDIKVIEKTLENYKDLLDQ